MKQGNIYLSENLVIIVKPYTTKNTYKKTTESSEQVEKIKDELIKIICEHIKTRFFKNRKFSIENDKIVFMRKLSNYINQKVHFINYQEFKILIPFLLMKVTTFIPATVNFSSHNLSKKENNEINTEIQDIPNILNRHLKEYNKKLSEILNDPNKNDLANVFNIILKVSQNRYKYVNNIDIQDTSEDREGEILIVYDSNPDKMAINSTIREQLRSIKEDIMQKIRMIIPGVNIEFFKIAKNEIIKQNINDDAVHIDYMNSRHPLYHLASRVCAAFVEYYSTFNYSIEKDNNKDYIIISQNKQSITKNIDKTRGVEIFTPSFVNEHKCSCFSDLMVRKIIDVKDAIEIVGEGVDGNTHDYPPCPSELQSIFQGMDNQADSVRERYKFPFGIWFRGSSNVCNSLHPSLFRGTLRNPLHPGCTVRDYSLPTSVYDETSMLYQFMAVRPQLRHDYENAFEWLCMAQHYTAPSRVLDWTENILIALYFAVRDNTNNCDSAVWALNAARLNELTRITIPRRSICMQGSLDVILRSAMAFTRDKTELKGYLIKINQYDFVKHHFESYQDLDDISDYIKEDSKKFLSWLDGKKNDFVKTDMYQRLASPIAVFPSRINERQIAQLACFTLYGGKEYDNELKIPEINKYPHYSSLLDINRKACSQPFDSNDTNSNQNIKGKPFLQMFVVPSFAKRKIREQLRRIGIHQASLMPELENQAKNLGRQWSSDIEY